ncbi:MAG: hypothetical protein HYX20_00030 [Candidatus Yanofskybacteria bacterium]|nr:hypothetical protein [Candidatus Yanofskybacteria bacterium]
MEPTPNNLSFLEPYSSGEEIIVLSSGKSVRIKKYFFKFKAWQGDPIPNTYGGKAVIDFNGEPLFAELAVLKLFRQNGWDGVWVDSYRKKYRIGLPDIVDSINLPADKQELLNQLRSKTGKFGGCWDLLLWENNPVLFIELKLSKKDRIQDSQIKWLEESLKLGYQAKNFLLVEWFLT